MEPNRVRRFRDGLIAVSLKRFAGLTTERQRETLIRESMGGSPVFEFKRQGIEMPKRREEGPFWVAELCHSGTGHTMGGWYWNGHTRPLFEPVTTQDIHEALKWDNPEDCQLQIDRCGQLKAGVLKPVEHSWLTPPDA